MNSINFCYWLRGFLEVAEPNKITKEQIDMINKHLDLVLTPVTSVPAPKGLKRDTYIKPMPFTPSGVPQTDENELFQQAFCTHQEIGGSC